MTVSDGMFAVSVDREAAQITLAGPAIGPAGGASVRPLPGVELVFDRAGGRLAQVVVEAGEPAGPVAVGEFALGYLGRMLGDQVAAAVRQAPLAVARPVTARPQPAAIAVMSRLARLGSARRTSPVPCSALWAVEAAGLACQRQRRGPAAGARLPPAPRSESRSAAAVISGNFSGWLDPGLIPAGVFRYGLSPDSDLDVRVHDGGERLVTVRAMVAPGADRRVLATCHVRLVDAAARRVLAVAPFRLDGPGAQARLPAPAAASPLCVEVVGNPCRPVRGTRLRRMRRALRWADAALRAASRPAGLDPHRADEHWSALAALAWERCQADWAAAGDAGRAAAAARLAREPARWTHPYLAEAACGPAAAR